MTREEAKTLWPIMKAWSEGEKIERVIYHGGGIKSWAVVDDDNIHSFVAVEYRIKPKLRDFWFAPSTGQWFMTQQENWDSISNGILIHLREVQDYQRPVG
jgi:hypothetical protein